MCCSCPGLYIGNALLFHLFQSVLCCLPLILCTLEVTRSVSVCWTSTSLLCVYQRMHLSLQTHYLTQKVLLPFVVCVCACVTCISVLPYRCPHKHSKNCQELSAPFLFYFLGDWFIVELISFRSQWKIQLIWTQDLDLGLGLKYTFESGLH